MSHHVKWSPTLAAHPRQACTHLQTDHVWSLRIRSDHCGSDLITADQIWSLRSDLITGGSYTELHWGQAAYPLFSWSYSTWVELLHTCHFYSSHDAWRTLDRAKQGHCLQCTAVSWIEVCLFLCRLSFSKATSFSGWSDWVRNLQYLEFARQGFIAFQIASASFCLWTSLAYLSRVFHDMALLAFVLNFLSIRNFYMKQLTCSDGQL